LADFFKGLFTSMQPRGIAAQAVGFAAMVLLVSSFQMKTRKKILGLQLASETLWVTHYALLGAYTGMALNFVAAARCFVYAKRETKKWADKPLIPWLFFTVAVIVTLLSWTGPASLLPMASVCITSFVAWSKRPVIIRVFSIPGCVCWFVFNLLSGSYAGVVTEILNITSIVTGIIRIDILHKGGRRQTPPGATQAGES